MTEFSQVSSEIIPFVKRNTRRLFELWFYGEIVSKDLKLRPAAKNSRAFEEEEEEEGEEESYLNAISRLCELYGLEIELAAPGTHDDYAPLDERMRAAAAAILSTELSIYSPSMLRKTRLKRIVLCSGINTVNPLCKTNSFMQGLASPWKGELAIAIDLSRLDRRTHRLTVNHEVFHCIDYFDDVLEFIDPWWESLNETGFTYSPEHFLGRASAVPGFVSAYAMSSVQEDKAEVFCRLIADYRKLTRLSETDVLLRKKVDRMKELLRTFCPEFNGAFWDKRQRSKY